jgi:hypothetical protein
MNGLLRMGLTYLSQTELKKNCGKDGKPNTNFFKSQWQTAYHFSPGQEEAVDFLNLL